MRERQKTDHPYPQEAHLSPGNAVQVIGKVNPDLSIKVLTALDLGVSVGESRPFRPPSKPRCTQCPSKESHTWTYTPISLPQTPRRRGLSHAPPPAVPEGGSTLTSPCPSPMLHQLRCRRTHRFPIPKHFDLSTSLSHTSPHSVAQRYPDIHEKPPRSSLTDHTQTTPWPTPWSRYPTSTEASLSTTKKEKKENSHGTRGWIYLPTMSAHAPLYLTATVPHNPLPPHVFDTQPNPICPYNQRVSGSFAADAETA